MMMTMALTVHPATRPQGGKVGTPTKAGSTSLLGLCLAICLGWGPAALADTYRTDANGVGPLVINEVLAVNAGGLKDPQGHLEDWIEIYNSSSQSLNLAGIFLTDDLSEPSKWQFPAGDPAKTTIGPKGYLLVWADGDTAAAGLHAGFSLDAQGEQVGLFDADGTLMDSATFGPQTADVSFGRSPDGASELRYFGYPTPAARNSTAYLGVVEDPLFSRFRGFYNGKFRLTITCPTPGATIRYSTDGTDPMGSWFGRIRTGRDYVSPLLIEQATCVRAVALLNGWRPSRIITHTYVLGATSAIKSLPAVSLVGDAGQTFYEPNGVMAHPMDRELERPVSFEWVRPEDNGGFQVDCGLRVHGSDYMRPRYTRDSKFSLRLYFRSRYGPDLLEYPLFPFEVQRFDDIVLRAGHNDMTNPFIKDELVRRLFKDMGHVSSGGTIANLFINGQYKGYYNPCEHIDEVFCQEWFDSNQPWDVVTMFGDAREGDLLRWNVFIAFAREHNLAEDASYATVISQLDIDDFVDYLILRLWAGDWDWPQNNWSAASERSEQGKWRFFVWDAEGSFFPDRLQTVYFNSLNSQNNENGYLYRALKANPKFRQLLGDRLYRHFYNGGALTAENVQRRFLELKDQMTGVLPNMDRYVIDTWVPQRLDVFFKACIQEGLYTFAGPAFSIDGRPQYGGAAQPGDRLEMATTETNGVIYYTLDGLDPGQRLTAGSFGRVTLVGRGAAKRWLAPTGPVDNAWRGAGSFDDSAWRTGSGGSGGVGYGRSGDFPAHISILVGAAMHGVNASCLIRIPFEIAADLQDVSSLTINVQYDAGLVVYLNGVEVLRRNVTGEPVWDSKAALELPDAEAVTFRSCDISSLIGSLRTGENILAIHGMNPMAADPDFLINAELVANIKRGPTPAGVMLYAGPVGLDHSVTVKARVSTGTVISALNEATFAVGPVAQDLRISEIMYHPPETGDPNDPNAEYIELANVGSRTINLNLVRFTDGVEFVFPNMDLAPWQYILVVKDVTAFQARHSGGALIAGQYKGSLSNSGEQIELQDASGTVIQRFNYVDDWYPITDGKGFSLTVKDPAAADPNILSDRGGWRPSAYIGGSPGWDDSGQVQPAG